MFCFAEYERLVSDDSVVILENPIRKRGEETVFLSYQLVEEELNTLTMEEFLMDYLSGAFE
jgi:hypothetical protein